MATCKPSAPEAVHPSTAALHLLKELVERDTVFLFSQALVATATTEDAARLAAEHGIPVAPEALWRHRGMLVSGGLPSWRG